MDTSRSYNNQRQKTKRLRWVLMVICGLLTSVCAIAPVPISLPDDPETSEKNGPLPATSPPETAPSLQANPAPSATSVWSSGTETVNAPVVSGTRQESHFFAVEDCGCAAFPGEVDPLYGPGNLECKYRWSGTYIDDNHASFIIGQYKDQDELAQVFDEHMGWMHDSAQSDRKFIDSGSLPDDEQNITRNDSNGFVYVTTGPGGGSSKTEGEIPMCGNGGGVFLVADNYLAEIQLFACDLGEDRLVYETAIETLEACALDNVAKAKAVTP